MRRRDPRMFAVAAARGTRGPNSPEFLVKFRSRPADDPQGVQVWTSRRARPILDIEGGASMTVKRETITPLTSSPRPAAGLRAYLRIVEDVWKVKGEDARTLLGSPARSTYHQWKKRAQEDPNANIQLTRDHLERISYVLGIYKALQILFPQRALSDEWMQRPNDAFAGNTPLQHALGGNVTDLADVRRYLDGAGGGF